MIESIELKTLGSLFKIIELRNKLKTSYFLFS